MILICRHVLQEGMFGLREWEEEGFVPQAQDVDDPSYDPVQTVKKARQPSARVNTLAINILACCNSSCSWLVVCAVLHV